jgi:hypothetical protein
MSYLTRLALAALLLFAFQPSFAAVVGTFSGARPGVLDQFNLFDGSFIPSARAALANDGHTLVNLDAGIDATALAGIDILYLPTPDASATILSNAEASAAAAWANGGGVVIVAGEGFTSGPPYNNFANLFDVDYGSPIIPGGGTVLSLTGTFTPLTDGPFGPVTAVQVAGEGALDTGSSSGISLLENSRDSGSLIYVLDPSTGFAGAGTIVFFADSNIFDEGITNGWNAADGATLWRNLFGLTGTGAPAPTYTVGGQVSGLTGTVTLQNNGADDLVVGANGSFTFSTALADGSGYAVTVASQPAGQTCTVTNGGGTIAGADVTNVTVTCTDAAVPTYSVGGTISGLSGTVVLQNNGGDDLSIAANGAFTFATALNDGAAYAVSVLTQPAGQTCTVSNGAGTVSGADVTIVSVTCTDDAVAPPPRPAVPVPTASNFGLALTALLMLLVGGAWIRLTGRS